MMVLTDWIGERLAGRPSVPIRSLGQIGINAACISLVETYGTSPNQSERKHVPRHTTPENILFLGRYIRLPGAQVQWLGVRVYTANAEGNGLVVPEDDICILVLRSLRLRGDQMFHSLTGCKAPLRGACISKTDLHTHPHTHLGKQIMHLGK